jgi:hypothetical protein
MACCTLFCVGWAASVGAGLGHRASWRAGVGRGWTTSDASTLDFRTWAPPAGCGGERLGCGSAGALRAAAGVDDRRPAPRRGRARGRYGRRGARGCAREPEVLRRLHALLEGRSVRNGRSATLSWERVAEQVAPVIAQVEASTGLTPAARSGLTEVCIVPCSRWRRAGCLLSMEESRWPVPDGGDRRPALDGREQRSRVRVTAVCMALCRLFSMGESMAACSRWRE